MLLSRMLRSLRSLAFWQLRKNYVREKARSDFEAMPVGPRDSYIVFKKEKKS
jgi:hypothetical protein